MSSTSDAAGLGGVYGIESNLRHLDLLSGVAPSYSSKEITRIVTKVTNLETVKIEFCHLFSFFFQRA